MNLIWLCPVVKKPVGGVKVIYRQAAITHAMLQARLLGSAAVMHPNTWFFKAKWFAADVPQRRARFGFRWKGKPGFSDISGIFNPSTDVVVLPEVWARKYGDQLARMQVPFAIYVQGGYLISKGDPAVLDAAYRGARCILTISDDASKCVAMAFPGMESKILRVHGSVDARRFSPNQAKENIITYMPRKLADHSSKVIFFLRNHLPSHWRIVPIDGLNEAGVADLLQQSKIFMSFSHFEGFGLPPLEAALSGNHVIGYTGQGAKEYWLPGIFEEIESGNVAGFAQSVLTKVRALDGLPYFSIDQEGILKLSRIYSEEQELQDMETLIHRMSAEGMA
jgi:hypothetical protein